MAWFTRKKQNIVTNSKKDIPDGNWSKCADCGEIIHNKPLEENNWVCGKCNYHFRIGSDNYIEILFDKGTFRETNKKLVSADPLEFTDNKKYTTRVEAAQKKTKLKDAVKTGTGKINGIKVSFACMDFSFIGGSMGSVVGEKIARAIDTAIKNKTPMIIISSSGGARMMEGAFSLMQMAKTSAKLAQLSEKRLPYISILTNPTTGGTTASYAMLGDVNIAEPKALIGFAGPRVIKETIGRDLPEGFQRSEFLLENGFLDKIVSRNELKDELMKLMRYMI